MSEGAIGFLILVTISVVTAFIAHCLDRRIVRASIISVVVATVLFHTAAYLHQGYVDPMLPIAVVVGGAVSFVIAIAIGVLVWKFRPPVARLIRPGLQPLPRARA